MAIRNVTRAGVGLVVGIIILGLLVLGGLWLVRERGETARREEAITIAEQQLQQDSNEDAALNGNESSNEATDEATTDDTPAVADEPAGATENDRPATAAEPEATTTLPQTGPEAASIAVLGVLSFAVVSFIRSRKLV